MLCKALNGLLALTLVAAATIGAAEIRDEKTGVSFPDEVSLSRQGHSYHLQATGTATRERFFVKVYSAAHYLQQDDQGNTKNRLDAIMNDDNAKQLTIKWIYNVDAAKLRDGYRDSFRKALPEPLFSRLSPQIDQYVNLFTQDINKGDVYTILWLPGGTVEVDINGQQVGTITNTDFAKGLWSLWFGKKSVVDRNRLAGLTPMSSN